MLYMMKLSLLIQICARCILKQFCLHEQICSRPWVATPCLSAMLRGLAEHDGASSNVGENKDTGDAENEFEEVCRGCIGILQFLYIDDKGISVRKNHACDFAAAVGEPLKHGGQKIDGFSLHVSLPPVVVDNEQAVWSYIKEKCSSESWFTEKFPPASITVKDFLKLFVANPLEKLLGVKCQESSFRRG